MDIGEQHALVSFVGELIRIREFEQHTLPIQHSALARDLFILIAYHTLKGEPISLKTLFYSVDFSEIGARKHLKRFLDEGWCSIRPSEQDKRKKYVVGEAKMLDAIRLYSQSATISMKPLTPSDPSGPSD